MSKRATLLKRPEIILDQHASTPLFRQLDERPGSRPAGSRVWPPPAAHLSIQLAASPARRPGVGVRELLPAGAAGGCTHAGALAKRGKRERSIAKKV